MDERNPPGRLSALKINPGSDAGEHLTDIPSGWQNCELNLNSSWHLGCNGTRLQASSYLHKMGKLFSFSHGSSQVSLRVRNISYL